MFVSAVKIAVIEAFRAIWYENQNVGQEAHETRLDLTPNDAPVPRRVTIDYPEEAANWPFILVQFHPKNVGWTGIDPDEIVDAAADEFDTPSANPSFRLIRQGRFDASIQLQIMSETSGERDRIWDNLIKIILMGRKREATSRFFDRIENNGLVGLTVMEGTIDMVGDTISMGTPWSQEALSYEATISFDVTGVFYADEFDEELVTLKTARAYGYISNPDYPAGDETPYGEGDGKGPFTDPWA